MAEYQQLVDDIRGFLAATDQTFREELASWAAEYARWCKETNDRLRQCRECLQKGLRSEAVHLAEKHPPLLDVFVALDFPELMQWKEVCVQYALTEPPGLAKATAQSLSDAYAEEAPLQNLLSQHRLLHLSQAPISPRLAVLRKIQQADPATPYWQDDVQALEELRIRELRQETDEALASGETHRLRVVLTELEAAWHRPVPVDLKQKVESGIRQLRRSDGQEFLTQLLPILNNAYSAQAIDECRPLLEEWDNILHRAKMEAPVEMAAQVAPIRAWIKEADERARQEKAFEDAMAALQQGLDADLPTPELERRYRAGNALPFAMYKHLEQQYRNRLRRRATRARRRFIVTVVAMVAAVLCLLIGGGTWYRHRGYEQDVAAWVNLANEGIDAVRSDHNLDKARAARQRVQEGAKSYMNEARVAGAAARLEETIAQEEQRCNKLAQYIARAQAAALDSPDRAALAAAETLALTQSERVSLQALRDKIAAYGQDQQKKRDERFADDVDRLRNRLEVELGKDQLLKDHAEFLRRLSYNQARLTELGVTVGISDQAKEAALRPLRLLLSQSSEMVSKVEQEQVAIETIAKSNTVAARGEAVNAYLAAFPQGSMTESFRKALAQADTERAVEAWDAVVGRWRGAALPVQEADAIARIEAIEKYEGAYPKSPLLPAVREYKDYITKALDGVADDGPWRKNLKRLLDSELITQMWVVQTTNGRSYFTPEHVERNKTKVGDIVVFNFKAYLSPNLQRTAPVDLDRDVDLVGGASAHSSKSPQMLTAEVIRERIGGTDLSNWAGVGLAAAEAFIKDDKTNPILRGIMLQRILQVNQDALDWALGDTLKKTIDDLSDLGLTDVAWMDPTKLSPSKIEQVNTIIKAMPEMDGVKKKLEAKLKALAAFAKPNHQAGGVLLAAPGGPLMVRTETEPREGMIAEVVPLGDSSNGDGGFKLVQIGKGEGKNWVLDEQKVQAFPAGTFVFIGVAP